MKNYIKELKDLYNPKIFIISLIIWGIYFITGLQDIYFVGGGYKRLIFFKFLHFIFIYLAVYFLFHVFTNRKKENYKHGIIIFSVFCLIAFILLFALWPGTWSWDDIVVLSNAKSYSLCSWQHFIGSIIYIVSLETIPFATGVIIIQIFVIAAIIGYCIPNIASTLFPNKKKFIVECILCLPMFSFPILSYLFSGFRMILYSFIEFLLFVKFILIYKKAEPLNLKNLLFISMLTIIVGSWRTEGIYYILGIILFLIMMRNEISKKKIIIVSCVITIAILSIGKINNLLINNNNYYITGIMESLQALVKKADLKEDKEELENIDKVIDIQVIYDHPNWSGETYYWYDKGIVKKDYTNEDFNLLIKSFIKLYIKYPKVGLESMFRIFWKASGNDIHEGYTSQRIIIGDTLQLFNVETRYGDKWNRISSPFKSSYNLELRDKLIRFLGCIDKNNKVNILYYIEWNLLIPLMLIILILIYKLIKKDYLFVFLIIMILLRVPLVILTSPAPYFMYYLSTYLCSWFIIFVVFLQFFSHSKITQLKSRHLQNNK